MRSLSQKPLVIPKLFDLLFDNSLEKVHFGQTESLSISPFGLGGWPEHVTVNGWFPTLCYESHLSASFCVKIYFLHTHQMLI